MKFTPGPPKPAKSVTVAALRATITETNVPTAAKMIGEGIAKVLMSGDTNYYTAATKSLRDLLAKHGVTL